MITAEHLRVIAGAKKTTRLMGEIAQALNDNAARYGVTHHKELLQLLANFSVETGGFTKLTENLNYSAKRLTEVWPKRFPTLKAAAPYANNPKALADKVYGRRMGNFQPGDGFKYIGRGPGQATGKDNYQRAERLTGIAFTQNPDLMGNAVEGTIAALALWREWGLDALAMADRTTDLRKRWNGGTHGLTQVKAAVKRGALLHLSVPDGVKMIERLPEVKEVPVPVALPKPAPDAPAAKPKVPASAKAGGIAAVLGAWALWAQCSLPQWFINWAGYAASCKEGLLP